MSKYYKINGLEVKAENLKLGNDTLIINMGAAHNCPSKRLGLCEIPEDKCYAFRDERRYPTVLQYRIRQAEYWKNTTPEKLWVDFLELFQKHPKLKKEIKYLRYNESGDFNSQRDVEKLDFLSIRLKEFFGIITYGYSARSDLNFKKVSFLVKGSSHDKGNSGECIAREMPKYRKQYKENGKTYFVCRMNCRKCKLCKSGKYNIAIPLH